MPVRKQYHFREDAQGLLAWDVHGLIAACQGLAVERIRLDALRELDTPYWYGAEGDVPTCRSIALHMRLVHEADLAYPIIVCPEGRLMDGMHRAVKALLEGRDAIDAIRLPQLPPPDYRNVDPDALPYE